MKLPGTPAWRRRTAVAFLALGALAVIHTLSGDLPHEQTLIFRLSESERRVPLKLQVTVTRAGESEARAGFTVSRDGSDDRAEPDPRLTLRLLDGDYVITLDCTFGRQTPKEHKTSRVLRVSLAGSETVVPVAQRASE